MSHDEAMCSTILCPKCDKGTSSSYSFEGGVARWHCIACGTMTDEFIPDEADHGLWIPLTTEEADAAMDTAEPIPISREEIEAIVERVVNSDRGDCNGDR